MRLRFVLFFAVALVAWAGAEEPAGLVKPGTFAMERVPSSSLENLFRVSSDFYSGGSPETPADFEQLRSLGINDHQR